MMAEQSAACHCTCCRKNSRSSLELRELHARTLSEMRGSISSLTTKYKSTLEAMETLKRESEENRRLSAMAANSAQIHCDEIKNGLQAMSLDANELVQILSTELSSVKEERDKLKRNQDVLCSKLSSVSQPSVEEKAVLVGQIQDLTRSRETLQVSMNKLRAKCSDLEVTVASLQEEKAHLLQREATVAPAVDDLRAKCSDLEATVASLQEEKAHPSSVQKILRLTRENQQFAVKLSEQENKSKALESTIMLLNKYLDIEINNGRVENTLFDILDDISHIKRTTNSREAKELIGMTEKGLEKNKE